MNRAQIYGIIKTEIPNLKSFLDLFILEYKYFQKVLRLAQKKEYG